jgi:hypothetical protein
MSSSDFGRKRFLNPRWLLRRFPNPGSYSRWDRLAKTPTLLILKKNRTTMVHPIQLILPTCSACTIIWQTTSVRQVSPHPASRPVLKLFAQVGTSRLFSLAPRNLGLVLFLSFKCPYIPLSRCIGKAFHIKDIVQGKFFYPKEDGTGDVLPTPRPLEEGELVCRPEVWCHWFNTFIGRMDSSGWRMSPSFLISNSWPFSRLQQAVPISLCIICIQKKLIL